MDQDMSFKHPEFCNLRNAVSLLSEEHHHAKPAADLKFSTAVFLEDCMQIPT
jgi:hypothetical protein